MFCIALFLMDRRLTLDLHEGKPSGRLLQIVNAVPREAKVLQQFILKNTDLIKLKSGERFFNEGQTRMLREEGKGLRQPKGTLVN